jgi:hypothetical protein
LIVQRKESIADFHFVIETFRLFRASKRLWLRLCSILKHFVWQGSGSQTTHGELCKGCQSRLLLNAATSRWRRLKTGPCRSRTRAGKGGHLRCQRQQEKRPAKGVVHHREEGG